VLMFVFVPPYIWLPVLFRVDVSVVGVVFVVSVGCWVLSVECVISIPKNK